MSATPNPRTLHCGKFRLALDRPLVMGVVNVTPDSFSDGGRYFEAGAAVVHARRLAEEGADLIDVGAESSRPGAKAISAQEELTRLMPVLEKLHDLSLPISIDTTKAEVMRAAIDAGAAMINDISALRSPEALGAVAKAQVGVCLMHMQGEPSTMQHEPRYADVVAEVRAFLAARVASAEAAGISRERLVIDPGFGFGKTSAHNFQLLRHLDRIADIGPPLMAGWSRKSSLGALSGQGPGERLAASLAAALLAVERGARILRVHDVGATRSALAVLAAIEAGRGTQ